MPEHRPHQTLLAFDVGTRHTGVAIGNTLSASARGLAVLDSRVTARLFEAIAALINEWQPDVLVVGRPLHPDGNPHLMTARSERFARQLHGRFRKPVELIDERYSTVEAKAGAGAQIDAEAAAIILRQYLADR
jgi:putative Holliday junction resolvase